MLCGKVGVVMPGAYWNRKHNETNAEPNTNKIKWFTTSIRIKTSPNKYFCKHPGVETCQYLRYKNNNEQHPFCAWNLEYRGNPLRNEYEKTSLQFHEDDVNKVKRPEFCSRYTSNYSYNDADTWENTLTKQDIANENSEKQARNKEGQQ